MKNLNSSVLSAEKENLVLKMADNDDKLFARDVREGLTSQPKHLPSKYFYDNMGDKIFRKIMSLPEYYLTRYDFEILDLHQGDLLNHFSKDGHFNLIEFGAGDGFKTKIVLQYFAQQNALFRYLPIDISGHVLKLLTENLKKQLPLREVEPMQDDYFMALKRLSKKREGKNVVLFLGSNIGNFREEEAIRFLNIMAEDLNMGDLVLIGFGLKKDPEMILNAYNDLPGVTRSFNLNLLERINRDLEADFDLEKFQHYPAYDLVSGQARSYLISKEKHDVHVGSLRQNVPL